jgi:peptidoglycan hydrolase-like protein with peptidoglycan-binding domain
MNCEIQTFAEGSRGECVKRIQQAISASYNGKQQVTVTRTSDEIEQAFKQQKEILSKTYVTTVNYRLAIDGVFGPQTANAVRKYQELNGLPVTGEIDADDWAMIKAEL